MTSEIRQIALAIAWILLGTSISDSLSNSLDPAPGRSPGPPLKFFDEQSERKTTPIFYDPFTIDVSHEVEADRRTTYEEHQGNRHTNAPQINGVENSKNHDETLVVSETKTPCMQRHKGVINHNEYVKRDEKIVQIQNSNRGNDDETGDIVEFDVIHDVFDTTNEPLIAGIVYTGKFFLTFSLFFVLFVLLTSYIL